MEQFYSEMEAKAAAAQNDQDSKLCELWKAEVKKNADAAVAPGQTVLKLNFRPRRKILDQLETKNVKLAASFIHPVDTVDDRGRRTHVNGYYEVYVKRTGWFQFNVDDSKI